MSAPGSANGPGIGPSTGRTRRLATRLGVLVLALIGVGALAAPFVATNDPAAQFRDHVLAPPMLPHVVDAEGRWHARPFIYPAHVVDRLERRFAEDRSRPIALGFFVRGRLVAPLDADAGPWLPLGADRLGRDGFARLIVGARRSLGVALVASLGAIVLGLAIGVAAGYAGGVVDTVAMRAAELVLVLPVLYVVLAARAALPATVPPSVLFTLMTAVLALLGWPIVARGVRAIVAREALQEFAVAARAMGASPARVVWHHLAPATVGFLRMQGLQLVPAAILAETTLSFAGLGFAPDAPSWGTLLNDASDLAVLSDAPWLLAAAGAVVTVVFAINLASLSIDPRRDPR
ncbi:MAG: ABC transporter permease [Vicinamibacteraceae bacterium]